jgi:hypothetical protein
MGTRRPVKVGSCKISVVPTMRRSEFLYVVHDGSDAVHRGFEPTPGRARWSGIVAAMDNAYACGLEAADGRVLPAMRDAKQKALSAMNAYYRAKAR